MKRTRSKIVFLFILFIAVLKGQDIHFSQYYLSPLSLNPANTGKYRGDYRFFGNYRSQWRDISRAYDTYSAGGDMNLFPKNINVSPGLIFISDRSGGNLNVTKLMPSFAYHTRILGYKLNLGVQPGFVTKSINFNSHSFPNQLNWDKGSFDNSLPNNEPAVNSTFNYFDLNAGTSVSRKFGKVEPEIGFALFHINEPRENFLAVTRNYLPIRQAVNVSVNWYLSKKHILTFHSLRGYTKKATDWVSGINYEYVLSDELFYLNTVFAGVMWRNGIGTNPDAGVATIGFNFKNYTIGFSYDITVSQLHTSVDYKGATEIAIIYKGKSSRLNTKIVPCERY